MGSAIKTLPYNSCILLDTTKRRVAKGYPLRKTDRPGGACTLTEGFHTHDRLEQGGGLAPLGPAPLACYILGLAR